MQRVHLDLMCSHPYWQRQAAAYLVSDEYAHMISWLNRNGFRYIGRYDVPRGMTWARVQMLAGEFDEEE